MKYALLIYGDEKAHEKFTEAELQQEMAEYYAYGNELKASKGDYDGEALWDTAKATTVKVRDGKTLTTDGPFAETREQLGGFYVVECADLDDAIKWASKLPGAKHGSIEIRPVVDFSQLS